MKLNDVKLSSLKQPPFLIAAGVLGVVCLIQLLHSDFLERLESITYDWRVREAANYHTKAATNLAYVDINEKSITAVNDGSLGFRFGLYWPRQVYGRAVRELQKEGAQIVAFDVLFAGLRPDHAAVIAQDDPTADSDEYFSHRLHEAGNVILAAESGVMPQSLFRTNALAIGDISAERDRDGIMRRAKAFHIYRKWHLAFQQVENDPDYGVDLQKATVTPSAIFLHRPQMEDPKDQIIRVPLDKSGNFDLAAFVGTKIPPRMLRFDKPFTEQRVWHLGIVLAAEALHLDLANADVELNKGRITLNGPNGIKRVIPVDADGSFYINWNLQLNDKRLTQEPIENLLGRDQARLTGDTNRYAQFLEDKQNWHNKLVIVGSTAVGNDLTDRGATPLAKDTFLMSEYWNVTNSILTGNFVGRSSIFMDLFLIILMGAVATFITSAGRSWTASVWIACVMLAYVLITALVFIAFRYWMPLVMPVIGGLLTTHGCLLGYLVIFEQAEKRRVRSVFNKVMAPDIVAELLNTEKLSLSGARRKVTIFFCDIRGFTEMTDVSRDGAAEFIKKHNLTGEQAEAVFDQQAKETLDTVNQYLKLIADIVRKNGGTVDKFIGDCVMAFWGAPIPNMHHALFCVRAAVETQRAVYHFNEQRKVENRQREATNLMLAAEGKPLLSLLPILVVGTGVNTGVVTVGLMGSDEQLNYTVFGRDVNLASRLEGVSGRSRIIISEATLAEIIQDDATLALSCKALDPVPVKGIREPVPVFEVPWREEGQNDTTILRPKGTEYNTGYFTAGERTVE